MNDDRKPPVGPLVELTDVGFAYPGNEEPVVQDINLSIGYGEALTVVGPTGGGKSTLLKILAGLLPASRLGRLTGERTAAPDVRCGVVFQSPDDQIVSSRVWDEVAFGLRQHGIREDETARRVANALEMVGLGQMADADPEKLSGGQKQRLVIAAAAALEPQLLILDEPLAQLDPQGAREVLTALSRLRDTHGTTLCVAEHRLGECLATASRVVVMADGMMQLDRPTDELGTINTICEMGLRLPVAIEVARRIPSAWLSGVRSAESLVAWAREEGLTGKGRTKADRPKKADRSSGHEALVAEKVSFRYGKGGFGIEDLGLSVRHGERVALLGANGSGKSTLLGLLAGLYRPISGNVRRAGRCGLTFQNPDAMLLAPSALAETSFGPRHAARLSKRDAEGRGRKALGTVGLGERADEPPLSLSRGQRLRLAVASVLSMDVDVLLLDEPTTGQDQQHMQSLLIALELACRTIVFSTHDVNLALDWANRVVVMTNGQISALGPPEEILNDTALVDRAGLRKPAVLTLCEQLGIEPCLNVEELAERLQPEGSTSASPG
jgi:energy-coupling factor transport system ATP-binding protein